MRFLMRQRLILTLIYFLTTQICSAEDIDEDYFFEELPVVLSVSRLEQPLVETTSSVTVIDQEMINLSGARDIPELLRLVPGFIVAYRDGNSPIATYHGFGHEYTRQLQVLINGRPIYSPIFTGVFWADIPFGVDDIERIEVIRGPNSALYGSNSFSSVISITTKQAVSSNKSSVHTKVGSNNYKESYLNKAILGPDWDFSFTLSRKTDDGFDNVHDSQVSNKLYSTYNYQINSQQTFTTELGYLTGDRDVGTDNSIDPNRNADLNKAFARFKWEYQNKQGDLLQVQYFYDRYKTEDVFSFNDVPAQDYLIASLRQRGINLEELESSLSQVSTPTEALVLLTSAGLSVTEATALTQILTSPDLLSSPVGNIDEIDFSFFTLRQEIELTYQPHASFNNNYRFITGFSIRNDKQNIKQLFNREDPHSLNQYRIFYNGEYRVNRLLFNLGLMVEDNEITGVDNMPKFSMIYSLNSQQAIRYTHSRASRSPAGLEELSDYQLTFSPTSTEPSVLAFTGTGDSTIQVWQSSGGLQREKITSDEIAYQHSSAGKRFNFDIKLFSNKLERLISFDQFAGDFDNTDNVDIKGLESSIDMRFKNFRIASGFSELDAKGSNIGDEYTQSVPENIVFLYAHYRFNKITLSSIVNHYSEIRMLDSALEDDLTFLNLNLLYQSSDINKKWLKISANHLIDDQQEFKKDNFTEQLFSLEVGFEF